MRFVRRGKQQLIAVGGFVVSRFVVSRFACGILARGVFGDVRWQQLS
jgi:hypothetical protein